MQFSDRGFEMYGHLQAEPNLDPRIPTRTLRHDSSVQDDTHPFQQIPISNRCMSYRSFRKPPYTYLGMILVAIESSPAKRLPLSSIYSSFTLMFPNVFRGQYQGWKDSVRHTLCQKDCFVSIKKSSTARKRGTFWTVDLSKVKLKDLERTITRDGLIVLQFAPTITAHLGLPDIDLPQQGEPNWCRPRNQEIEQNNGKPMETTTDRIYPEQQTSARSRLPFNIDSILGKEMQEDQLSKDVTFEHSHSFPGNLPTPNYVKLEDRNAARNSGLRTAPYFTYHYPPWRQGTREFTENLHLQIP